MTAAQVAATPRRRSLPFVVAIVAGAFILGALAGLGLPRALGSTSDHTTAAAPAIVGRTTGQTMDDARRAALYGPQVVVPTGQSMDDARRAALYGPQVVVPTGQSMDDARRAGLYGTP